MSNNEAPERIWVWHHEGGFFEWPSVHLEKPSTEVFKSVEYIRADLVAELEAERDALKAERNSAVKLCREHNLCLCNFSQKLAGDGCFICR